MRTTRIIANTIAIPLLIGLFTLLEHPSQWVRTGSLLLMIIISVPLLLLDFGELYASLPDETGKTRTIRSTRK